MSTDPVSQALDQLYAAPLDEFVARRKQLASELRVAGNVPAAQKLLAAAKPTRTAWALNQVARERPALLEALVHAREEAAALRPGDAEQMRRGTRAYRDCLNEVAKAARERLSEAGVELNATQMRRLTETLQAASAQEGEARAHLMAGMLTRDVDIEDPFAGLALDAESTPAHDTASDTGDARGPPTSEPGAPKAKRRLQDDALVRRREAQERAERARRMKELQARVGELAAAAREEQARARAAQTAASKAARDATQAQEAADKSEALLAAARAELERLSGEHG